MDTPTGTRRPRTSGGWPSSKGLGSAWGETDVCANRYHEHAYGSNHRRWPSQRAAPISISTIAPEPLRGSTEGRVWGTADGAGRDFADPHSKKTGRRQIKEQHECEQRHPPQPTPGRSPRNAGMAAQPQIGFLESARMRARPVGPAQSSAFHNLLVEGRRRRPIDGLSISQTDSYVAKRGRVTRGFCA